MATLITTVKGNEEIKLHPEISLEEFQTTLLKKIPVNAITRVIVFGKGTASLFEICIHLANRSKSFFYLDLRACQTLNYAQVYLLLGNSHITEFLYDPRAFNIHPADTDEAVAKIAQILSYNRAIQAQQFEQLRRYEERLIAIHDLIENALQAYRFAEKITSARIAGLKQQKAAESSAKRQKEIEDIIQAVHHMFEAAQSYRERWEWLQEKFIDFGEKLSSTEFKNPFWIDPLSPASESTFQQEMDITYFEQIYRTFVFHYRVNTSLEALEASPKRIRAKRPDREIIPVFRELVDEIMDEVGFNLFDHASNILFEQEFIELLRPLVSDCMRLFGDCILSLNNAQQQTNENSFKSLLSDFWGGVYPECLGEFNEKVRKLKRYAQNTKATAQASPTNIIEHKARGTAFDKKIAEIRDNMATEYINFQYCFVGLNEVLIACDTQWRVKSGWALKYIDILLIQKTAAAAKTMAEILNMNKTHALLKQYQTAISDSLERTDVSASGNPSLRQLTGFLRAEKQPLIKSTELQKNSKPSPSKPKSTPVVVSSQEVEPLTGGAIVLSETSVVSSGPVENESVPETVSGSLSLEAPLVIPDISPGKAAASEPLGETEADVAADAEAQRVYLAQISKKSTSPGTIKSSFFSSSSPQQLTQPAKRLLALLEGQSNVVREQVTYDELEALVTNQLQGIIVYRNDVGRRLELPKVEILSELLGTKLKEVSPHSKMWFHEPHKKGKSPGVLKEYVLDMFIALLAKKGITLALLLEMAASPSPEILTQPKSSKGISIAPA